MAVSGSKETARVGREVTPSHLGGALLQFADLQFADLQFADQSGVRIGIVGWEQLRETGAADHHPGVG